MGACINHFTTQVLFSRVVKKIKFYTLPNEKIPTNTTG
jgi:hypothetical protein